LFGTASKTDLAGGSMPDFGRTRLCHIKNGRVRLKPFWKTEGGHQCAFVGGKSLDFPTRKLDLRRSFSQPRKNVDKHFCLGAEILIASASHLGVEGRSPHSLLWYFPGERQEST
jgi:hypothetical protein